MNARAKYGPPYPDVDADTLHRLALPDPRAQLAEKMKIRRVPSLCSRLILEGAVQETPSTELVWRMHEEPGTRSAGRLLALAGNAGRGKTLAASWLLSHDVGGFFVTAAQLALVDENTSSLDKRMRETPLLVIDDLGVEHSPSGFAGSRLDSIVTHRWESELRTLITTNNTAEQFKRTYGDRIASRMNGDPLGWQNVAGSDLRCAETGGCR